MGRRALHGPDFRIRASRRSSRTSRCRTRRPTEPIDCTTARYSQPAPVRTCVMSATHRRSGPSAEKYRSTRSGADRAFGSRFVVPVAQAPTGHPSTPSSRIRRGTDYAHRLADRARNRYPQTRHRGAFRKSGSTGRPWRILAADDRAFSTEGVVAPSPNRPRTSTARPAGNRRGFSRCEPAPSAVIDLSSSQDTIREAASPERAPDPSGRRHFPLRAVGRRSRVHGVVSASYGPPSSPPTCPSRNASSIAAFLTLRLNVRPPACPARGS